MKKECKCRMKESSGRKCALKCILCFLTILSLVAIVGCLLTYFIVGSNTYEKINWLQLSELSVMSFQGFAMLLTLLVAYDTYKTSRKIENVKGLVQLREMLNSEKNMEVHKAISAFLPTGQVLVIDEDTQSGDLYHNIIDYYKANMVEVNNYLGTLELSKLYLDEGIIDDLSYYNQFGYRVENITEIVEALKCDANEAPYWLDLFKLLDKVQLLKPLAETEYNQYKQSVK